MKNILFIGLGNIGVRHFESINNLRTKYKCYFIDPNINKSKKKIIKINKINQLIFLKSINMNEKNFDLSVISTNSDVRKEIILTCLKKLKIKKYLIEKIPFNNVKDYNYINQKFRKAGTACYINYVRNYMPCYINLKKKINQKKNIHIGVYGKNWNLASNSFHFLSLFSFLNNNKKIYVDNHKLTKPIKSKRKNFYETRGFISIKTDNGDTLNLHDDKNSLNFEHIMIKNDANIFIISEIKRIIYTININKGLINARPFNYLLQSQMTQKFFKLDNKNLDNLNINFRYKNDITLLNFFKKIFEKKIKNNNIPIT